MSNPALKAQFIDKRWA